MQASHLSFVFLAYLGTETAGVLYAYFRAHNSQTLSSARVSTDPCIDTPTNTTAVHH